jgi:hypothetical protein
MPLFTHVKVTIFAPLIQIVAATVAVIFAQAPLIVMPAATAV